MSTLQAIKTRIQAVKATHKVTSSMYMVSTAKFRRSMKHLTTAKTNMDIVKVIRDRIPTFLWDEYTLRNNLNKTAKKLILVLAGDRGLCGGFNTGIFSVVNNYIKESTPFGYELFPIGQKAVDFYTVKDAANVKLSSLHVLNLWTLQEIDQLATRIQKQILEHEFSEVVLVRSQYVSSLEQKPVIEQIFPLEELGQAESVSNFFGREDKWLSLFLHQHFVSKVWLGLQETITGEFAARMVAMDGASKNCSNRIEELQLEYNKGRQARITKELIEIISGAETINEGS